MNDLPDDVLLEIFSYFSAEELVLLIGLVNTRWNILIQTSTLWRNIIFTPPLNMTKDNIIVCLSYMPKLKSFRMHHENFDEIITAMCAYCEDVKSVVVEWKRGPNIDALYKLLYKFPSMECLQVLVPGSEFKFDYAKLFGKLYSKVRLSALNNRNSQCSNSLLPFTQNSPALSKKEILQKLKENRHNLEIIAISCQLSIEMLQCIGNCNNLKYLYIANDHFYESDFDMSFLGKLINLETLQLQCFHNCSLHCSEPDQIYFNLTKLEMVGCGDSVQLYMNDILKSCPKLKHLNIQEIDLEDENLMNISCCRSLTYLDASDSYILSDGFIKYVASGCHNLEFLDVSYCAKMTSNIIEILAPCLHLQCLQINGINELHNSFTKIPILFPYIKEVSAKDCYSIQEMADYIDFTRNEWSDIKNLEKTVNDLPDDVLFEIFAYFSAEELALSIGLVDTRWNRIAHTETLWKRLTFTPSLDMNEQDIEKCLKYMPKLRSFKLRHGKFIDQIVSAMCNYCEDVRTVVMEWKHGPSSDKVHELVKTFPNLERLDVHSPKTQFTIDYAKLFGEFHRKGRITALKNESNHCLNFLEKFIENLPPESDDFMQELKDNKDNLETIAISCEPTTEILHSIGNCSNLKYLFIADNHSEQNDFDVSFLRKLINLETLQLQCFHDAFVFSSTPVSYQIYSNLTKLEMVSCKESFKVIMNDILRHCPTLKQLNIQETHFEDEDLKNISYCKSLTHLDIAVSYYLSDDFIEWVANSCLDLQFLDVSYAERITNNIIYILVPCRHLQCLRMNGIHDMTSTILEIPTLFPQIKELAIKHCKSLFGIIEYHDFNTKEWTGINVVTCSQDYEWCNSSYEQDCESGSTEKDFEKDSAEQDYLSSSIINENNNEFEKFTENGSKEQDLEIPSYEQSHESSSV